MTPCAALRARRDACRREIFANRNTTMRKTGESAGIRGGREVTASANIADSIDEVKLRNSEVMEAGRLMTSTQSLTHIHK